MVALSKKTRLTSFRTHQCIRLVLTQLTWAPSVTGHNLTQPRLPLDLRMVLGTRLELVDTTETTYCLKRRLARSTGSNSSQPWRIEALLHTSQRRRSSSLEMASTLSQKSSLRSSRRVKMSSLREASLTASLAAEKGPVERAALQGG